jgi:hypothetical protein
MLRKNGSTCAAEGAARAIEQAAQIAERAAAREAIDIGDQLRLILQGRQNGSPAGIHPTGTSGTSDFNQSAQSHPPSRRSARGTRSISIVFQARRPRRRG